MEDVTLGHTRVISECFLQYASVINICKEKCFVLGRLRGRGLGSDLGFRGLELERGRRTSEIRSRRWLDVPRLVSSLPNLCDYFSDSKKKTKLRICRLAVVILI